MQNNINIYFDIFTILHTKEEAGEFCDRIDDFVSTLYAVNQESVTGLIQKHFDQRMVDVLLQILQISKLDLNNRSLLKEFLQSMKDSIKSAKIADIRIAIVPDLSMIVELSSTLREMFSDSKLLLAIKTDSQMMGGLELIWNGKYWNFSLEKEIDEWFKQKSSASIISNAGTT